MEKMKCCIVLKISTDGKKLISDAAAKWHTPLSSWARAILLTAARECRSPIGKSRRIYKWEHDAAMKAQGGE